MRAAGRNGPRTLPTSQSVPNPMENDGRMAAFLVFTYDVTDNDRLLRYREAATQSLLGPGGGELVASTSKTVHLAEATSEGTHTVILRFQDAEHAHRVYTSEGYRAILNERLAATTPRIAMIVPEVQ